MGADKGQKYRGKQRAAEGGEGQKAIGRGKGRRIERSREQQKGGSRSARQKKELQKSREIVERAEEGRKWQRSIGRRRAAEGQRYAEAAEGQRDAEAAEGQRDAEAAEGQREVVGSSPGCDPCSIRK